MRTSLACFALRAPQVVSFSPGSHRMSPSTATMPLLTRQERLADGPFKLIETPAHAQKATVYHPRNFSASPF